MTTPEREYEARLFLSAGLDIADCDTARFTAWCRDSYLDDEAFEAGAAWRAYVSAARRYNERTARPAQFTGSRIAGVAL